MNVRPQAPEPSHQEMPRIEELIPHKPPMILLDDVLSHADDATVCRVRIGPTSPFVRSDGAVPSWVALEYMAQCTAAHAGLRARDGGRPVRPGFLLGSRKVVLHEARFRAGQELAVSAREAWTDGELASFECSVSDRASGAMLVECALVAYSPRRIEDVLERQHP